MAKNKKNRNRAATRVSDEQTPEQQVEQAPPAEEPAAAEPQTEVLAEATAELAADQPAEPQQETQPTSEAESAEVGEATTEAGTTAEPQAEGETTKKKGRKAAGPKKTSALDAAAQVLAEKGEPMTAPELIVEMATKGLWESPGGKTPAATLYSALLREITTKGSKSRFTRPAPGKFDLKK